MFIIMLIFLILFKYSVYILQKLGVLLTFFKQLPQVDGDWEFIMDVDEKLDEYWASIPGPD